MGQAITRESGVLGKEMSGKGEREATRAQGRWGKVRGEGDGRGGGWVGG